MRKFRILALVLAAAMALGLFGCKSEVVPAVIEPGFDEEGRPIINLWAEGSQREEAAFTALCDAYNALPERKAALKLQFIRSGTFDAGISGRYSEAYKAGEYRGFDIIAGDASLFTHTAAACGNDENAFLPFDPGKLPNLANMAMAPSVYPTRLIPYRGTTAVFAYDSARLPQPPKTWQELADWIRANPGRFTYCDPDSDSAGNAFLSVALHLHMGDSEAFSNPADPKWADCTDGGFQWLAGIHPYLYSSGDRIQYPTKNLGSLELLASGEIWLTPVQAEDVLTDLENHVLPQTVMMYQMTDQPLPGLDMDLAVCAGTVDPEACWDIINFVIGKDGQQLLVKMLKSIPAVHLSTLDSTALTQALQTLEPGELWVWDPGKNENQYRLRWAAEIATLG